MDVKEAVLARRSIRAFSPEPVPQEILKDIMEKALWAPSWGNTQGLKKAFPQAFVATSLNFVEGGLERKIWV